MIYNLDKVVLKISQRMELLKGFEVVMTGNLANANLLEDFETYQKSEVCLVVPLLINMT